MKVLIGNERGSYTFSAASKTITISGLGATTLRLEQLLLITNTTTNQVMYSFADSTLKATIASNVITLTNCNTTGMANTDRLQILVELPEIAYDAVNGRRAVETIDKRFRDGFAGSAIDATKWASVIGSGMTATVASNVLTIATGTTASASTTLTSVDTFRLPARIGFTMYLSQRIANQSFFVELVSVNETTLVPDEKNIISYYFSGATATNAYMYCVYDGSAGITSSAITTITSASNAYYELEAGIDRVFLNSGASNSTSARTSSVCYNSVLPNPNSLYKLRIRVTNGGTAPASTTNMFVSSIFCNQLSGMEVDVVAGRGATGSVQGVPVTVVNTTTVSGTVTANWGTITTPTLSAITSAATTNATSVKASAGSLFSIAVSNTGTTVRYLKLYNKASAPTVGTDVPVLTIPVAASSAEVYQFGTAGMRFSTGYALALTSGIADSDTTVAAVSEVKIMSSYI